MLALLPSVTLAQPTDVLPLSAMGEGNEQPVYWDFSLDSGRGSGAWRKIRVPSNWEQEGFGAYYYGMQGRGKADDDPVIPKERGHYRRTFEVPERWRDRQVRIVFDAVMTDAHVRINGELAGAPHQGGFYRFEYDITRLLKAGTNTLEVEVAKESANPSINRAERRGDYWAFAGIYRPVWLEARPAQHIDWTAIDARHDGRFYARVHLSSTVTPQSVVRAQVFDAAGRRVGEPLVARTLANRPLAIVTGTLAGISSWSAETPHLYSVKFSLHAPASAASSKQPTPVVHETTERFGFRTFEVRPRDGLYLNGQKIVLKGINRHSFSADSGRTLTRLNSVSDIRSIKGANMNAVRMSHYPPDAHFLEAADELGVYVLNELAGWQGAYDTPSGARLIGQIVRRDVNHPSILFWDNGNEGGWNLELDGEFDRWDPQRRAVLHPWATHSGVNTDHYEQYESTVKLSAGPDIFMPTEFLHGLYDGGIGAGLRDYWDVMGKSPTVGGAFFWVFADEGIARTDQGGRIDNMGNLAPDGIVGPRGEKEGSYFTVKEIWSPVQVKDLRLEARRLQFNLENRYDFTNLQQCTFTWRVKWLPAPRESTRSSRVIAQGRVQGPKLAPREHTAWSLTVPVDELAANEALELTAVNPAGLELWTWVLPGDSSPATATAASTEVSPRRANAGVIESGPYALRFDQQTGELVSLHADGKAIPIQGPRLIASRRNKREFQDVAGERRLRKLVLAPEDDPSVLAAVEYDGALRSVTWSRIKDELVVSYEIQFNGEVDVLGLQFDYPESQVSGKRWLGAGPYRIWQNRVEGTLYGVHKVKNAPSIPGEVYAYPEFPGYFGAWRWVSLDTANGTLTARNDSGIPYFGLYQPRGGQQPVLQLPDVRWSFLHVIPAMGTKFDVPDALGPSSRTRVVNETIRGRIALDLSSGSVQRSGVSTH